MQPMQPMQPMPQPVNIFGQRFGSPIQPPMQPPQVPMQPMGGGIQPQQPNVPITQAPQRPPIQQTMQVPMGQVPQLANIFRQRMMGMRGAF